MQHYFSTKGSLEQMIIGILNLKPYLRVREYNLKI